ncbi:MULTISPECIES: chemotaxis protein CheW [Psychrobacillus]|uniref:Chemotaxis protein CheW n=1 Tax=Psychrobacillus faecigallinarum TaxID=2762235 RepID=A0ABR8R4G7_9BACI|nr:MULTISPECIES: chemotaxis protein CheW [Psychrobacillus]MBD7942675.1 chemotaxis protein CheW [Psychrobacillus faecigallinarum]QEY20154.1 chemotaxis protein CheW [Psychrobacillus sp. AK 1817]QGM30680.1 chemotaxis protein CheW [Bacillus sp. N3536]
MAEALDLQNLKVVVFQLADKEYVIPVSQVQGIEKLIHITRVPKTPSFVKGVINLRGVVTPIIDLKSRFNLGESTLDESSRIIIISLEDMNVGVIVDSANDVLDIPMDSIEPQPEVVGGLEQDFIAGVTKIDKRLLILLHLDLVLNPIKAGA